jgi:hypothetical protein
MKRVVPSVYAFMCGNGGFLSEMNEDEQQDFPKELAKAYEERLKEMELLMALEYLRSRIAREREGPV